MRLYWNLNALAVALAASTAAVTAFAPSPDAAIAHRASSALRQVVAAAGPDVKARQEITLEKLKAKDAASHAITKDVSVVLFLSRSLFWGMDGGGCAAYTDARS
jgi:hypothetical protein